MSEGSPRWALLQTTIAHAIQPLCAPDDQKVNYSSFLFFSPRDAKRALLEMWADTIGAELEDLSSYNDDDLPVLDGWIEAVELWPDKSISAEGFEWSVADIYGFFGMEVPGGQS